VLTTRERTAWLDAVQAHYAGLLAGWGTFTPRFRVFGERITRRAYGAFPASRSDFAGAYDAHEAAVAAHFATRPGDLLRIDVCAGAGWAELAAFLGAAAPPIDEQPFPHATDADETSDPAVKRTLWR
jgi:hypothetical protein